jgi:hypothetical protein
MKRDIEPLLNDLLRRWHRWANCPARPHDTLLRDFDTLVSKLSPRLHGAIVAMARNASAGVQVWSSPRVDASTARRARARLLELVERDATRWFGPVVVNLNERGNRIGESNPMADASDSDVDLCLQLREEGYSLAWLAAKFEVSKSCVAWWCNGGRRGQAPMRVKEVAR